MDVSTFVQQILSPSAPDPVRIAELSAEMTMAIVDRLQAEVEHHFYVNANRSLEIADAIEWVGRVRGDQRIIALALMKRADSLRFLGRLPAAWQAFHEAGEMLLAAGDEIGWARTRIGRLLVCVDLNRVAEAVGDAEQARAIFSRHALTDRLLVLDLHLGIVFMQLGEHRRALEHYRAAMACAEMLGPDGNRWLAQLHTNLGNVYDLLGDFGLALKHHRQARTIFAERDEPVGVAQAGMNAAHVHMAQGHYRRALQLLHEAAELYRQNNLPLNAAFVGRDMTECFLVLNRFAEARDLARQVSTTFGELGSAYEQGLTLLHLAVAEGALHNYAAAQAALDRATPIFARLGAENWAGTVQLCRGRLAFRLGNLEGAEEHVIEAEACFDATGQPVDFASAALLRGQITLARGDVPGAIQAGKTAEAAARRCRAPSLRYATHLFLGRVEEAQGNRERALRRYRAAVATVERVQRRLTITLRPGFLVDKEEALRALLALYLAAGEKERAFDTLERAKSQVLLNYLVDREQLQWRMDDPLTQRLASEVEHLRARHNWLYRLANGAAATGEVAERAMSVEEARSELVECERRIRMLTEQLYLQSGDRVPGLAARPVLLRDIQQQLDDRMLLVEYWSDGDESWAFTIDADGLEVHRLPLSGHDLERLVRQLQLNVDAALKAGPRSPVSTSLHGVARRILGRLYEGLIAPLEQRRHSKQRLVIVPYGVLHYVPMHLLHTGSGYLIEQAEVVILPAAGLITRPGPRRPAGARVLAHSWSGLLPHTLREAGMVRELVGGGEIWQEDGAQRPCLRSAPLQVLHIAAHAAFRLDQPDLSYIELADGQVYADDLMQEDMSYELVTLSACETGRADIAAGDELIGLGRGFLYGGAGALIASSWRVADDVTVELMENLYGGLRRGASKAAALREAQRAVKNAAPELHPAFWGAWQLIGDPRPLSGSVDIRM